MTTSQVKHIDASMRAVGEMVEKTLLSPEGERAHFAVVVWTDTGFMFHIENSQTLGTAEALLVTANLLMAEIEQPVGPMQ